jgi:hypothetical protein
MAALRHVAADIVMHGPDVGRQMTGLREGAEAVWAHVVTSLLVHRAHVPRQIAVVGERVVAQLAARDRAAAVGAVKDV